jgi:hypothetical protein
MCTGAYFLEKSLAPGVSFLGSSISAKAGEKEKRRAKMMS